MLFALDTLRVQLIVLGIKLEFYIALFFVGYHQIQIFAKSTADERRLARIESQDEHASSAVMNEGFRSLVACRHELKNVKQRCQNSSLKARLKDNEPQIKFSKTETPPSRTGLWLRLFSLG